VFPADGGRPGDGDPCDHLARDGPLGAPQGLADEVEEAASGRGDRAWEEAGVRGRPNKTPIGRYVYLKELDDGDVAPVMVEMYQVKVTKVQADFKEKGQRILAWVSPDEAARRVREVELKSMLVNFKPMDDKP